MAGRTSRILASLVGWLRRRGILSPLPPADSGRSLRLITDYIEPADLPLYGLLPIDRLDALDSLYVGRAWTAAEGDAFVLGADFYLDKLFPPLCLPGLSQIKLHIGGDEPAQAIVRVAEHSSFSLTDLELTLEFDPTLLTDPTTNEGAKLVVEGASARIDADGFHFNGFTHAELGWVRVGGTDLELKLDGITSSGNGFGFLIAEAAIRLPEEWGKAKDGSTITFTGSDLRFNASGISGIFRHTGAAIEATLFNMGFRLTDASVQLRDGVVEEAYLRGSIDISHFAPGGSSQWLEADLHIGTEGVTASLRDTPVTPVTPPGDDEQDEGDPEEGDPEEGDPHVPTRSLAKISFEKLLDLNVVAIRLEVPRNEDRRTLWLSGTLQPKLEGDWPEIDFDEIGIDSTGSIRLAEGASIGTSAPFSVDWHIAQLTVSAFRLERPRGAADELELHISAGIKLIDAIPAGVSVEGLVARWKPGGDVTVSFAGIGVEFGIPGAFNARLNFSYNKGSEPVADEDLVGFHGEGELSIEGLDLSLSVVVEVGKADGCNTLFLAAESDVFPGGIPIGATALSLYGVSGLLAYNMELEVDKTLPLKPKRYFDLFIDDKTNGRTKVGFADSKKWSPKVGASALGLGVVVGTSDDGWALSGRGALMLTLPDLALILTATGDVVSRRKELKSTTQGKLSALLAVLPAEDLIRLDFEASWEMSPLFVVNANGGGEFHFTNPLAWKVWLGQPPEVGTPVGAKLLKLGEIWLFSAGYWFGIDGLREAHVGGYAPIELRIGTSNIYAELVGSARGDLQLMTSPLEISGSAKVDAQARLVACGLSLGFSLNVNVGAQVDNPLKVAIELKQCIDIDLVFDTLHICLAYTFSWWRADIPEPQDVPVSLTFAPRAWVPGARKAGRIVDDGVVTSTVGGPAAVTRLPTVFPHSEISIGFPASMSIDEDVLAKDVVLGTFANPPRDLFSTVSQLGTRRTWHDLELVDLGPNPRPVELWGSFLRTTSERKDAKGQIVSGRPLQSLFALWSSKRFSDGGSNSGGGGEATPEIDCKPQGGAIELCAGLARTMAGETRTLSNGWRCRWIADPHAHDPAIAIAVGPDLHYGEELIIWVPEGLKILTVASVLIEGARVPRSRWRITYRDVAVSADQTIRLTGPIERTEFLLGICWKETLPASPAHPHDDVTVGKPTEVWDIAADKRLLWPGHGYRMTVTVSSAIENEFGAVKSSPSIARVFEFDAADPPLWDNAMSVAMVATYPNDGSRPVYRDYDLIARFDDDWTEAMYRMARRDLAVRLLDMNGKPVLGPDKKIALLPTAWRTGPRGGTALDQYWRAHRMGSTCEPGTPPGPPTVVLPIALKALGLLPLTRYTAELIAPLSNERDALDSPALARWSFTTSRFANFTELAGPPASPHAAHLIQIAPSRSTSFDDLIRSFEAPSVAVVGAAQITLVTVGDALAYLLIEAPEPLDDMLHRLTVTTETANIKIVTPAANLKVNVDGTRIIVLLSPTIPAASFGQALKVTLDWTCDPTGALPEQRRTISGAVPVESSTWTIPLDVLA